MRKNQNKMDESNLEVHKNAKNQNKMDESNLEVHKNAKKSKIKWMKVT